MDTNRVKRMTVISMLSALSFLLLLFAFPIIPGFAFLKIDFADIPIFIGTMLFGPLWGTLVGILMMVIDILVKDGNPIGLLGIMVRVVASICFITPIYYSIYKTNNLKRIIMGLVSGTILMTLVMFIINLYITLPLYFKLSDFNSNISIFKIVLEGIIPFNIIKGILEGFIIVWINFKVYRRFIKTH